MSLSPDLEHLTLLGQIAVKSCTAVLLASLGEIVTERSGVLNLGLEGMLLCGALAGFCAGAATGSPALALGAAALAGGLAALAHAWFTVHLGADQVLCGLTLSLLGTGLTGVLGRDLQGAPGLVLPPLPLPFLSKIPVLGTVFFTQPLLTYCALILSPLMAFWLARTRLGLRLRACGENPEAAHAAGAPVRLIRVLATCCGGTLCGLGGAFLSLSLTPGWRDGLSGGQGWIAIAMVIFALWHPLRALGGSLFFGGLVAAQFAVQTENANFVPVWLLRAMPYLLTIAVLALAQLVKGPGRRFGPPAGLGALFRPQS